MKGKYFDRLLTGTAGAGGVDWACGVPELSVASEMAVWDPDGLLGGILLKTLCFFCTCWRPIVCINNFLMNMQ